MIIALLDDRNMGAHFNDVCVDRLAVEVVNTCLINLGLTCGDAACDDAAICQSFVKCNCGATECFGNEILSKVNIREVASDV